MIKSNETFIGFYPHLGRNSGKYCMYIRVKSTGGKEEERPMFFKGKKEALEFAKKNREKRLSY